MTSPPRGGEVVHLELHTADLDGAVAFYRSLLGWRPREVPVGERRYLSVDVGLSAGLVGCGAAPAMWVPYVVVDDLEASTRAAVRLGAEQTLAPRSGPEGRRSVLRSPAFGDLALWEPA